MDSSPPCAGLLTPVFDELFEAFKIAFDLTGNYSERISSLLNETFGVIKNLKIDTSTVRTGGGKLNNT